MNGLERLILTLFPTWAARRAQARYVTRSFSGADLDRLRTRTVYASEGPNQEGRASRATLAAVARDLDNNNSFAHGAFNSLTDNIIGRGLRFESAITTATGRPREAQNRQAQEYFDEWAEGVDVNRRVSLYQMQHLAEREIWVAGETLLVRSAAADGRRVPLALEHFSAEQLAPLDSESPRIIQGVEFGPAGNITHYHLYPEHPSDSIRHQDPMRVPASRVLHLFDPTRIGQVRGISRVAAIARNLEALDQYMDHELTRARIHSAFALMIKRANMGIAPSFPSTGETPSSVDANGNPVDGNGNPIASLEGGMIMTGGPQDGLEGTGPAVQGSGFGEFIAVNQRAIATGLNMSYELFARDYSKTNFSSARQSSIEDQRHWTPRQERMISQFCRPVYGWYTFTAYLAGLRPYTTLDPTRIKARWITPPRPYVEPQREVKADIAAVNAGFVPIDTVCAKQGTRSGDNIRHNAEALRKAEAEGVEITSITRLKATNDEPKTQDPIAQAKQNGGTNGDKKIVPARSRLN